MAHQWLHAPFIQYQRKPRQFFRELFVQQRFDVYDDQQLRARYRFGQAGIRYLEKLLGDDLRRSTDRNRPVPVRMQILVALRFYATGHFLQVIGDTFGLEKSVVSRIVHRVSELLEQKKDTYIRFPSGRELDEVKTGFYEKAGFPNVAGCIGDVRIDGYCWG